MHKYTFLIFYKEYEEFLKSVQHIGVLHVVEKSQEVSEEIKKKYMQISEMERTIQFLIARGTKQQVESKTEEGSTILKELISQQKELESQNQQLDETKKLLEKAKPWGNFSIETIQRLKNENVFLHFYTGSKMKYQQLSDAGIPVELISETQNQVYFLLVQKGNTEFEIDLDEIKLPEHPYPEIENKIRVIEKSIAKINENLDFHAENSIPVLTEFKNKSLDLLDFEAAVFNTEVKAENKLMVLEGWVPETKKLAIDQFLLQNNILFVIRKASKNDRVPILLKNNKFSKLFEPVGAMFSLPDYSELDLTVFFAPFFMLFFGFCLGDAGYGLLFIFGAGVYKLKAANEIKPLLSLIQFLGLATVVFGAVSGTFFGINLIETEIQFLNKYKSLFLNPDKMFNLALLLGGLQIVYGLCIKAVNKIKQYGISYSLATFGWLIIILGSVILTVLTSTKIIQPNKMFMYFVLSAGGFLILFFSDPEVNIFSRVGKGIWDIYSTVTGIFGDLLSYIRLFALGLSSAILGFVINDIALQIQGSSKIFGPVFFVLFLVLGHTLNILISSLGSFVHPMRLTFVEFYKNAGFKGGGIEYKPFSIQHKNKIEINNN